MKTFPKNEKTDQPIYIQDDLNLNLLDYQSCSKVNKYLNLLFQYSVVQPVSRPTRICKNNATSIDHKNTTSFVDSSITTGLLKINVLDYFLVFFVSESFQIDSIKIGTCH